MKIIVSLDEAREAARRHFSLPASAVIVIGRKGLKTKQAIVASGSEVAVLPITMNVTLRRLINEVDALIANRNLIGAIKEIRTYSGTGLKSAKDTVENWASVRAQAIQKGYLPEPIYDSSVASGISRWT